MIIKHFTCYEVIVPAKEGVIESKGINKPLHKLPVGAKSGWSMQFDQLPKLILKMELTAPIRRGLVQMHGSAYVGNKLVSEGELTAQIVRRKEEEKKEQVEVGS